MNKPSSLPANGGNAATVNSHTVLSDVPANAVFTDTTYTTMGASGSGHASGLVPDPGSTAGTTKFLREDGTWQIPESGGSVIPIVLLYEPNTPELGMVMFDAGNTDKFYQYQRNNNTNSWVEISTPHKAIGVGNKYEYEIIDGVVSQTAMTDLEYKTWYIFYIGQNGQVMYHEEYGGGILPTWDDIDNWNNKQDAITFNSIYNATTNPAATMADVGDVSDKENVTTMVYPGNVTAISPAVNTLSYKDSTNTLAVTLPTITDRTKVHSLSLILDVGSTPNISFTCSMPYCEVIYPSNFVLQANNMYEINCMWFDTSSSSSSHLSFWAVIAHELFYGGQ